MYTYIYIYIMLIMKIILIIISSSSGPEVRQCPSRPRCVASDNGSSFRGVLSGVPRLASVCHAPLGDDI